MRLIYLFFAIALLYSCKKFEHSDQVLPECSNCAFADSLTGTYRGEAGGVAVVPGWGSDSVTLQIQHIFMNTSKYEDSTVMHFRTAFKYDSQTKTIYDTIQITSNSGKVKNSAWVKYGYMADHWISSYEDKNYFIIRPDTAKLYVIGPTGGSGDILYVYGVFIHQ